MQISKSAATDVQHQTAKNFHLALEQNNPSLLLEIVKNHHVDSMDKDGLTLLHRSVLAERIEFVQQLISLGANVTLASRDGWSPLHLAAFTGNNEILVFLLKSSSGTSENI
ncbi:unnamed protein product [Orchesella dallaii]|uniref:Notch-regulated ankyrin repeat-containing protein n=1 Tax=Orchesella dallaii TaxID=48710 RepID=A0ABP1QZM3_9HEXA